MVLTNLGPHHLKTLIDGGPWKEPGNRWATLMPGDYSAESRHLAQLFSAGFVSHWGQEIGLSPDVREAIEREVSVARHDAAKQAALLVGLRLYLEGPEKGPLPVPPMAGGLGLVWVLVFLSQMEISQSLSRRRGIDDLVWKETWGDLNLWTLENHRRTGSYGLGEANWLAHHGRGEIFQLGRLQYLIDKWPGPEICYGAHRLAHGDPIWSMHIPAGGGLSPQLCGESHSRALAFIQKHFPEKSGHPFTCTSWVMSPDLEACGEGAANLVHFQKRFFRFAMPGATDDQMWERVFGRRPLPGETPPLTSRLQKAIWGMACGGNPKAIPPSAMMPGALSIPALKFATAAGVIAPGANPWALPAAAADN